MERYLNHPALPDNARRIIDAAPKIDWDGMYTQVECPLGPHGDMGSPSEDLAQCPKCGFLSYAQNHR